ncbi:MAG: hypothetical protein JO086_14625, partial [Acidimicrobiia bacterium]|nr:hypothetical protein [Acidimicrobiia bacterium]
MAEDEGVLDTSIEGPVARLTLDRPSKLNALNEAVRRCSPPPVTFASRPTTPSCG